jgi:hypothetical protein
MLIMDRIRVWLPDMKEKYAPDPTYPSKTAEEIRRRAILIKGSQLTQPSDHISFNAPPFLLCQPLPAILPKVKTPYSIRRKLPPDAIRV